MLYVPECTEITHCLIAKFITSGGLLSCFSLVELRTV